MKLTAKLSAVQGLTAKVSSNAYAKMQTKEITPTEEEQIIVPDPGYVGLSRITVTAIPSNYGRVIYDGNLTIV